MHIENVVCITQSKTLNVMCGTWGLFLPHPPLALQVDLNPNTGIFITMNPAGKGYGGRQKLPDNLKQLFRPVAMAKPDNEQIAEVILFAEGFKEAKTLGRKLVAIFNLSR